jgi:DNA mismatch repair ATPase MutS
MLTTHFIKVCKKLDNIDSILNCKMDTEKIDNQLVYKYKLKKGISQVKGGINILTEMNYPKEIIENTDK